MPGPHRIPDPLRGEVFRGSEALREGLITRKQLAANWRRLFRDVYADITIEPSHAIRCHAVMRYVLPEATITGASAAYLYGVKIIPADGPVEVVLPVPHGPVRGVLLHHGPVRPADIDMRDGLRVSTPLRACWDLLRHRPFTAAMAFVDQLIRANLVTSGGLTDYAEAHRREPGSRLMLRAADIADAGAESPQESRTRVGLIACGVPAPVTQHVITDRGRFVGRADMAWPDYFVALEYDGYKYHSDPADLARDRARLNRLAVAGWIVIHATSGQVRADFDELAAEVLAALRSRGWPGPPRLPPRL